MMFSLTTHHILQPGVFGQPTTGPEAAIASWKAVNPTTYTYKVKPGIKFSDGTTMKASRRRLLAQRPPGREDGLEDVLVLQQRQSITAKGDIVTIKLKKPDSKWQYTPAASPALVYSQADYLKKGASFGTPSGLPVGTGPYKWVEYAPNSRVVLERNPYWKGTKYPWNRIVFPLIPDPNARLLALQSGQIDGTFAVPPNDLPLWLKASNMKVGTFNSGGWRGFSIDIEDGPFKDVNVRRAIAYSIDKATITEALTSSRGQVLEGLPPLLFIRALLPKAEIEAAMKKVPTYPYSIDKAKAELAKSAYPKGFETTLNVPTGCVPRLLLLSQVLQQGTSEDRDRHQAEPDAGAAAVPGHPRPQAEPRHPGAGPGARTRRTRWTSPTCSTTARRPHRGTRTRRTTRTRRWTG